jgi:omega-6 fatty acid desaturase (delta-12 desaturase)
MGILKETVAASTKEEKQTSCPLGPPPFTLKNIRDAVPAHCFERSVVKSFYYVAHDLFLVGATLWLASYIPSAPLLAQIVLWPLYWVIQGIFMTGLWVIAHECGHQSFSPYKGLNNTVGLVLHSLLLVPYHSWRITHSNHHKNNAHIERDQVFVPSTRSKLGESHDEYKDVPFVIFVRMAIMFLAGWPAYLLMNITGQTYSRWANHFTFDSPLFQKKQRLDIIISDAALVVVFGILFTLARQFSVLSVLQYYFVPYLFVNFWLVLITFLQHTDTYVPHYRGPTGEGPEDWNFLRGALATVDRDYGILNYFHHHIGDTHVCHHLFSTLPHYHATEASQHIKKAIGDYYMRDDTPIAKAAWNAFRNCRFVEDTGRIVFYRKD